ncbi:hypothetical protein BH23GEM9_BH23GEM9_34250 [soil metagenome]
MTDRMTMMVGAAVLAAVVAGAPGVEAQGMNLQVLPKIGVFTPLGSLTEDAEMEIGLALGVAGEINMPGLPFSIRLNVEHAVATDVVRRDAAETVLGEVSITNVVGDIVLRPLPPTASFQPYFMGGGGVKMYSFDSETGWVGSLAGLGPTTRRGTLHVGGGVDARFGPLALVLEVSDYISTFADAAGESRLQNHLYGMLGFRVSMF